MGEGEVERSRGRGANERQWSVVSADLGHVKDPGHRRHGCLLQAERVAEEAVVLVECHLDKGRG